MHSPDLSQDNIAKIRALFPDCVTEAADDQGIVRLAVDFDQLRQTLSDHIVEGPQERYRLDWPGKREALLTANAPIAKTLRPCRDESVNFDTTQNLFIEGDNLDALKLLQESYLGKVKLIYIDPPYNTGKDFIYEDDFAETSSEYLARSNQSSVEGSRLVANTDVNGRFHSDWLTMIYSRLRFARNMLSEDGVIFCSINHKEISQLKIVMDEIFGGNNLLCIFAWRTDGNFDNQAKFKFCHEYILAYAKNEGEFPHPKVIDPNVPEGSKIFKPEIRNTIVKNGPKNPASKVILPSGFPAAFDEGKIEARNNSWPHYDASAIVHDGKLSETVGVFSGWSSRELLEEFIANKFAPIVDAKGQETTFEISRSGAIEAVKVRGEPSHVISWLTGFGGSQKATVELAEMDVIFDDYPKPTKLIKYFVQMSAEQSGIFMDFFSGSATTAHAVLTQNSIDGQNRKYIMVQLPEKVDPSSSAYKAGFKNISEISKERLRRAGEKVLEGDCHEDWNRDVGFRVLKVDSSNMTDVFYRPDEVKQDELFGQVDSVKPDRTGEDLLFQVLIDWGVELTLPINRETMHGKTVFSIDGNALIACFEPGVTDALVKDIAARAPLRAVFRDTSFARDADRINAEQLFRQLSPGTELKAI